MDFVQCGHRRFPLIGQAKGDRTTISFDPIPIEQGPFD